MRAIPWDAPHKTGCPTSISTTEIFRMSNRLQMIRVHAGTVPTEMIKFRARISRKQLIDEAMGKDGLFLPSHPSVAEPVFRCCPYPATVGDLDLLADSLRE